MIVVVLVIVIVIVDSNTVIISNCNLHRFARFRSLQRGSAENWSRRSTTSRSAQVWGILTTGRSIKTLELPTERAHA